MVICPSSTGLPCAICGLHDRCVLRRREEVSSCMHSVFLLTLCLCMQAELSAQRAWTVQKHSVLPNMLARCAHRYRVVSSVRPSSSLSVLSSLHLVPIHLLMLDEYNLDPDQVCIRAIDLVANFSHC
jgi:hypothetical protein